MTREPMIEKSLREWAGADETPKPFGSYSDVLVTIARMYEFLDEHARRLRRNERRRARYAERKGVHR